MPTTAKPAPVTQRHYFRTTLASLCGGLAISLLFASVLLVWVNRTLTDTTTYTRIVGSLADKQEIQTFVADKTSGQVMKDAPVTDIASTVLTPEEIAGKTPEQLQPLVKAKLYTAVLQIVRSPQFVSVWKQTNQNAQMALVAQLKSDKPQDISLDLTPIVTTLVELMKQTQLAPVADKVVADPGVAKINLKGGALDRVAQYYRLMQQLIIALVVAVALLLIASVAISVHHLKTVRRILMMTGIVAIGLAVVLQMPSFVPLGGTGSIEQKAIAQIVRSLFHDLQLFSLIFGVGCIVVALATKFYSVWFTPKVMSNK